MAIRKAVSIILTRNPNSSEVYLVERNPVLKFFGGYFAFPGGTLDDADADFKLKNATNVPSESLPYLVAAARELFEETGVLLGRGSKAIPPQRMALYRKDLLAEEIMFKEILEREELVIDAGDFHFIESLLTPEFAPVRYDTQFYWVQLPAGQQPTILEGELINGDFYSAGHALELWRQGEMFIVPPVLFMLQEFTAKNLRASLPIIKRKSKDYRQGAIHEIYFTPGVRMVPLQVRTVPPATHTNAYLVGEKELFIIDPAPDSGSEQKRLWRYLDECIAAGQQLTGILVTHHHPDHIGALLQCQKRYDLPVYAHQDTIDRLRDCNFQKALEHGDELDLGETPDGRPGWKLKIYHTPGHAPGHLVFQENRYGTVFAGDLISTLSTVVISPPEGHLATYLRSLQFLETVTSGMLCPGHGPAVKTGKRLVQHFIKHRQEREEKLLAALTNKPQTPIDLVRIVYDDVNPALWSLARHSLHAGLIKLIEEKKCVEVKDTFARAF